MKRRNITKREAPLDVWAAEALNEFSRRNLKTPTPDEIRNAYEVGESPQTWAGHIAGQVSP